MSFLDRYTLKLFIKSIREFVSLAEKENNSAKYFKYLDYANYLLNKCRGMLNSASARLRAHIENGELRPLERKLSILNGEEEKSAEPLTPPQPQKVLMWSLPIDAIAALPTANQPWPSSSAIDLNEPFTSKEDIFHPALQRQVYFPMPPQTHRPKPLRFSADRLMHLQHHRLGNLYKRGLLKIHRSLEGEFKYRSGANRRKRLAAPDAGLGVISTSKRHFTLAFNPHVFSLDPERALMRFIRNPILTFYRHISDIVLPKHLLENSKEEHEQANRLALVPYVPPHTWMAKLLEHRNPDPSPVVPTLAVISEETELDLKFECVGNEQASEEFVMALPEVGAAEQQNSQEDLDGWTLVGEEEEENSSTKLTFHSSYQP